MRKKDSCVNNTYIGNQVKENDGYNEHNHTKLSVPMHHAPAQTQFAPVQDSSTVVKSKSQHLFERFILLVFLFIALFIFWYLVFNCWKPNFCCCQDKGRKGKVDCWRILGAAFIVSILWLILFALIWWCLCRN